MKKLAIIILMKNHSDLTMALLDSISANDDYDLNYLKIYIGDTGSDSIEKEMMKRYIEKCKMSISFIEYDYYNFAKINNNIVRDYVDKDTDLILLCNNDVQLINNAISKAVSAYENNENVGTVGALLLYTNYTIQHGGIAYTIIDNNPCFTHLFLKQKYFDSLKGCHDTWGNTGAFMLTSYKDYLETGGLNENYQNCFEDVEYNFSLLKKGKRNITCYDAICFHKESSTRHQQISIDDIERIRNFGNFNDFENISYKIIDGLLKDGILHKKEEN